MSSGSDRPQATRGVTKLYDDIESLLEKIKGCLDRVAIHLPKHSALRAPPTPALMNIFTDTLVQVFIALAITTKYCDLVFEEEPGYKKIARNVLRRTRRSLSPHKVAYLICVLRGLRPRARKQVGRDERPQEAG